MKKKIVFLTGTRADFGYIKSLIDVCIESNLYEVFIFVTGTHLEKKHGYTIDEINNYGYKDVYSYSNREDGDLMDIMLAKAMQGFSAFVKDIRPDLVVVMGDRIEMLAATLVGCLNNILTVHVQAGDVSGTIDDSMRHAISKMAHVHLCANDIAMNRLIRMGENKDNIFIIGSPSVDNILYGDLPSIEEVRKMYKITFEEYAILAFHPVTTEFNDTKRQIKNLVDTVIDSGLNYVVIHPNNDMGYEFIFEEYKRFDNHDKVQIFSSIKYECFLRLMSFSDFMIGNSSSAIIEAPYFSIPVVNIGTRQQGRGLTDNIFNCSYDKKDIMNNIKKALDYSGETTGAYGSGKSSELFIDILNSNKLWRISKQKKFNYGD